MNPETWLNIAITAINVVSLYVMSSIIDKHTHALKLFRKEIKEK